MPVPNNTPATATEVLLSTLPLIGSQNVLDGTVQTVYFKITNDLTHDAVISLWFYGVIPGNAAIDYVADFEGFLDLAITDQIWDSYPNCYIEVPIPTGDSWWVRVSPEGAGAGTPTLNYNISLKPYSATFAAGLILIVAASVNDQYFIDNGGLHAGFINPALSTPATRIVNFLPFFPPSEHGDTIGTTYLYVDSFAVTQPPATGSDMYCLLYNTNFTLTTRVLITPPTIGFSFEPRLRANQTTQKYWLASPGFGGAPNRYATVTTAGVISSWTDLLAFPAGASTIACAVGNNDSTYLMCCRRSTTFNFIDKWNLVTLAWDGTIGTEQTNYNPTDILAMADGTFVVCYVKTDNLDAKILQYNAAGTLLNSLSVPVADAYSADPRIGYARDTDYFWFWGPKNNGLSILKKIKSSDFSVPTDTLVPNVNETAIESASPNLISVSDCCPVIETPGAPAMFLITPNKRTDHDGNANVKIPNPTFKTALLP